VVRASYGSNYAPLAALKARFDPQNLFRMNQNIPPAPWGSAGSHGGVRGAMAG